jgi:hypothetical protein
MLESLKDRFYSALGIDNDDKIEAHAFGKKSFFNNEYKQRFAKLVGGDSYQIFEHFYFRDRCSMYNTPEPADRLTLISEPQSKVEAVAALQSWEQENIQSGAEVAFVAKSHYGQHL